MAQVGELRFSVVPAEQASTVISDTKGAPFIVTVCRQARHPTSQSLVMPSYPINTHNCNVDVYEADNMQVGFLGQHAPFHSMSGCKGLVCSAFDTTESYRVEEGRLQGG